MFVTSKRRKCCNDPDIFCYICGCFTLPPQRRNINSFIKKIYLPYFGVPLDDQEKLGATPSLHNVCRNIEILVSRKECEAQIWCANGMERNQKTTWMTATSAS